MTGETSVRNLAGTAGRRQDHAEAFMKSTASPGPSSSSTGRPYSRTRRTRWRPRDTTRTTAPKPRQGFFLIERDTAKPVFYRVLQGSVADKTALIDAVNDSGCKDCFITADEGFCSLKTLTAIMGAGERFILPLQDAAAEVDSGPCEDPDDRKFDDIFYYNGRPIWCKKTKSGNRGIFYYIFRDDARGSGKRAGFVAKAENDYDEGEKEPQVCVDEKRPGYSLRSDLDVTSRELYMALQRRRDTREGYDHLKTGVSPKASNERTDDYFRDRAYPCHVSMRKYTG